MTNVKFGKLGGLLFPSERVFTESQLIYSDDHKQVYRDEYSTATILGDFASEEGLPSNDTAIYMFEFSEGEEYSISVWGTDITFGSLLQKTSYHQFVDPYQESISIIGSDASDYLWDGTLLNDTLKGRGGRDNIFASGGNDLLDGGAARDKLIGGLGSDKITGGTGTDIFEYWDWRDSSRKLVDEITDFKHGEDVIRVGRVDAISATTRNEHFEWIGTKEFTEAGQIGFHYAVDADGDELTIIEGDVDHKGKIDLQIALKGHIELDASDFIL
jgi:Ca2+-binding RTX toxin-like protein